MGLLEKKSANSAVGLVAAVVGVAGLATAWWRRRKRYQPKKPATNGSEKLAAGEFETTRLKRERQALKWLFGWGSANVVASTIAYGRSDDPKQRHFHGMNTGWGLANLINAAGKFSQLHHPGEDEDYPTKAESSRVLSEAREVERRLRLDCGLDAAILATGAYLWDQGRRRGSERLSGYGPSLVAQGAFLLCFDGLRLMANKRYRRRFESKIEPSGEDWFAEIGASAR